MALTALVYVSLASKDMQEADLAALLAQARRNNEKANITGMLLFLDKLFIQALEGEKEQIEALYGKIQKDSRHRDVTTIISKPIKSRSFGEWTMGFKRISDEAMESMEGYSHFLDDPSTAYFVGRPSYAQALLENFRSEVLL